jgi:Flp pilus assembly pilin Flp
MNKFFIKHKRVVIILLIAVIIIGVAYYFTLGKDLFAQNRNKNSEGSLPEDGSNSNSIPSSSSSNLSFPLKWGIKNSNTTRLQQRLNISITTCKKGSTISEDGILGEQTVAAIKSFFPNIGTSVATNRQVSQLEYSNIINSKPGC